LRATIAIVTVTAKKTTNRKEKAPDQTPRRKKRPRIAPRDRLFVDGLDLRKKPEKKNHRTDART
jgi:hypothetical protein